MKLSDFSNELNFKKAFGFQLSPPTLGYHSNAQIDACFEQHISTIFMQNLPRTWRGQLVKARGVEDGDQSSVVNHKLEVCVG